MLGVACDVPFAVVCPFSTSIGFEVSIPEKLWMPPTAYVFPVTVHL
ncbi:MAG TPA: hypothetical protein VGA66_08225 [Mycobacterium sp.]